MEPKVEFKSEFEKIIYKKKHDTSPFLKEVIILTEENNCFLIWKVNWTRPHFGHNWEMAHALLDFEMTNKELAIEKAVDFFREIQNGGHHE